MSSLGIVRRLLPEWGTTYGPPAEAPLPAVLILHGSEGGMSGWSHRNAAILAASGFLAYPHGYSVDGNAWNAGSIENVELMRTVEAIQALRNFDACDGRVVLYGVSRGAEHALLVASLMAQEGMEALPEAVACLTPPDVVCGAFDAKRYRDPGDPGWQAWDAKRRAWCWNGESDSLLPTTPIPIEHYPGPLFLAVGLQDATWSPEMTRRLEHRRVANQLPVEAHYYAGEGHIPGSEGENKHHRLLLDFLDRSVPSKINENHTNATHSATLSTA
ncbi:Alpha/beta hydrolase family protein [Pseudovibrio axinellae]|uniref:Alpha/beta hydrolase family protein n=1 Tax=Pseudovibrio axinellae TaxID=989403 RepID=A0A165T3F6_9HYPH|nr:alpha/beta hydrolase [Pseudovibrio axinellae]KZL05374.1 Alpha/beta hydrolase family protein [Pseudovibrio axinellae]SER37075.1 BAAT / Acyl-CoA thioester hydrolase C terminal [Pseudovibrio axinellae]